VILKLRACAKAYINSQFLPLRMRIVNVCVCEQQENRKKSHGNRSSTFSRRRSRHKKSPCYNTQGSPLLSSVVSRLLLFAVWFVASDFVGDILPKIGTDIFRQLSRHCCISPSSLNDESLDEDLRLEAERCRGSRLGTRRWTLE
jgi:hypothetical protein